MPGRWLKIYSAKCLFRDPANDLWIEDGVIILTETFQKWTKYISVRFLTVSCFPGIRRNPYFPFRAEKRLFEAQVCETCFTTEGALQNSNSPSLCSPHNMSRKIFSKDCKTDFFTLLIEALLLWTGWRYNDTGDTAQLLEGQVLQCHVCNCIAIEPCIEMIGRSSWWVQICRD